MLLSSSSQQTRCCIIPNELRDQANIVAALLENNLTHCQFSQYLEASYSYKGENFCILHLPLSEKKDKSSLVKSAFNDMVAKDISNFDFINASNLGINCFSKTHLQFNGAYLWSLAIRDLNVEFLSLSYAKLRGLSRIEHATINRMYLTQADISTFFEMSNCIIQSVLLIQNSRFYFNKRLRLDAANYGVHLKNSKFEIFRMLNCECELELCFDHSNIRNLDIRNNTFYLCPSLFNTDFAKNNFELILPKKNDFNITKLIEQSSFFKWKNLKSINFSQLIKKYKSLKYGLNSNMLNQYYKFREFYNLAKNRNMFVEQGDYYFLMQKCLEKTDYLNIGERIISRLYRWLSNYGQSTVRPCILLLSTWLASSILYALPYIQCNESSNIDILRSASLTSIQQVIKPYNILMQSDYSFYYYIICFLESTLSITLLALLIIALRWNFRKN